jgi:hypothetical protein
VSLPHTGSSAVIRILPANQTQAAPLPKITNFKATPIPLDNARDQLALQLTWDPVSGAQRYVIHLAEKGQLLRPIDETFLTRYIASRLKEETEYKVQVTADTFDGNQKSNSSKIITVKTRSLCVQSGKLWAEPWRIDKINFTNVHTKRNRSILGDKLSIRNQKYDFGMGTHAGSKLIYNLTRLPTDQRNKFSATIGIDDCALYNMKVDPACIFVVTADQQEIYRSDPLTIKNDPLDIEVALPDTTKKLILSIESGVDSPFNHADWINPRIE